MGWRRRGHSLTVKTDYASLGKIEKVWTWHEEIEGEMVVREQSTKLMVILQVTTSVGGDAD